MNIKLSMMRGFPFDFSGFFGRKPCLLPERAIFGRKRKIRTRCADQLSLFFPKSSKNTRPDLIFMANLSRRRPSPCRESHNHKELPHANGGEKWPRQRVYPLDFMERTQSKPPDRPPWTLFKGNRKRKGKPN